MEFAFTHSMEKSTDVHLSESKGFYEDRFECGTGDLRRISPVVIRKEPSNSIFYSVFLVLNTMIGSGKVLNR